MVSKELQDKIRTGIVKGNPVNYDCDSEEKPTFESEEVRRDI